MNNIIDKIIDKAKKCKKTVVLPEATDVRVLMAAEKIYKEEIADIILIGNTGEIQGIADSNKIDVSGIKIINPVMLEDKQKYIDYLYELRKEKGMTVEMATEFVKDPVYFAVLLVKLGQADGVVSGAIHSTADTLRPALQIIKAKPNMKTVSSFFLMEIPNSIYEKNYIFSDCGLIPNPTSEELATIALSSKESFELLVENEARIAMLSYSTLGSAKSESIDKVVNAVRLVKEQNLDIKIDGELQLDAAIDKKVANLKAPKSEIAGTANVLIFPNLEAGNIGYKLVERFGGANAYGPITQGLAKPVNDLSRGCKWQDIVGAVAITAVQASEN